MNPSLSILFFIFILCFSNFTKADIVSLKVADNIHANADYQTGEPNKPLLIFIHGFLQTRNFPTVKRLSQELNELGYSVLSVNLSLGIDNRQKSLACESIHLHKLDNDTKEIAHWVEWAKNKGHQHVILIGHSAGSVNITAYLAASKNLSSIDKTILISLTHYGPNRPAAFETTALANTAYHMLKTGSHGLEKFSLAFCENYVSTAENFLSYYNWSNEHVVKALNTQPNNNVIIGSADKRISAQWLKQLQGSNAHVKIIKGANHFFDQTHEFDLLDAVESILEQ